MSDKPTPSKQTRRQLLKKSTYIAPAVLTMAIAPSLTNVAHAQDSGKGKGKGKGGAATVPEPGAIGLLGLGLAALGAKRAIKKSKDSSS